MSAKYRHYEHKEEYTLEGEFNRNARRCLHIYSSLLLAAGRTRRPTKSLFVITSILISNTKWLTKMTEARSDKVASSCMHFEHPTEVKEIIYR